MLKADNTILKTKFIVDAFPEYSHENDGFEEYVAKNLKIKLSNNKEMLEKFIELCKDDENIMYYICSEVKMDEDIINKYVDYVNWTNISEFQNLSEDFIRQHSDKVQWTWISMMQHLSENFISEFKNKVVWDCISEYQNLSEDFIKKHEEYISWRRLRNRKKLSFLYFFKHFSKIYEREDNNKFINLLYFIFVFISLYFENMLYMPTFLKKRRIIKTGVYECHDDYFIAYKGIRRDRYSSFNFLYQYNKGGIYESYADYSDYYSSFGLSAWTKKKARLFCDDLVVTCKIYYKDLAYVSIFNDAKIRCSKLEILD